MHMCTMGLLITPFVVMCSPSTRYSERQSESPRLQAICLIMFYFSSASLVRETSKDLIQEHAFLSNYIRYGSRSCNVVPHIALLNKDHCH